MFYDPRKGPDPRPDDDRIGLILLSLMAILALGLSLVTTGLQ